MLQQVMVGWTFTRTLTTVLMKLNSSLRLRLYNKKSDVIRPYYSLTYPNKSTTSSTMYCVVSKLNVSTCALRPTTIAKIRLRTDCCNDFTQFCKYGSESFREQKFHRAKVLGTFAPEEYLTIAATNVPGNESSTGTKVPSVDFSFPGTKVQRNEKSRYCVLCQRSNHISRM